MSFEDSGEGLAVTVLNYYEESMVVLEQFIDLGDCGVVDLLEPADLLLKQLALMTAYLVLIDNINCPHEGGLDMNDLPQLVKLVLLKARRQYLILLFNAPFDLLYEVILFELDFLPIQDLNGGLIGAVLLHLVAHLRIII